MREDRQTTLAIAMICTLIVFSAGAISAWDAWRRERAPNNVGSRLWCDGRERGLHIAPAPADLDEIRDYVVLANRCSEYRLAFVTENPYVTWRAQNAR